MISHRFPLRRRAVDRRVAQPAIIVAAWTLVAMVAAVQAMAFVRLDGRADMAGAILSRLSIIPLWALATPLVLRSARRFPVVDREWNIVPASIAAHLVLGSLFVVLSNVLIRIPNAFGPDGGLVWLARATMMGVAEYYPPAMVVYGVIVAIGHAFIEPNEPVPASAATETIDDAPEASAVAALDGHLAVRQWNRVHLVRMDEIDFVEAEDNYVVVHASSRAYKGRDRISDVEAQLDSRRFVRIHRSTIVHVAKIREVQPLTHGDHAVVLRDGKVLRVARSRREALGRALGLTL